MSEDRKVLKGFWKYLKRSNFLKKKKSDNKKQDMEKSDSQTADIPKLTVVFDLDSTLIYTTPKQMFPGQHFLPTYKHYTAIRPYCDTVLKNLRPICNLMVFSLGRRQYVQEVVTLIDPNKEYFDKVLSRHNCTKVLNLYSKDLRQTGADLKRTVLIDDRMQSFMSQPFNGIPILPWTGEANDEELLRIEKIIMELLEEVRLSIVQKFINHLSI
ncbi:CTD small phosphatase-like protein 2 [Trichinella pseudospiralis]|uniref:Mitochondrial import inner membrane translocase subunit TIM50 n=2 Tax=Trichinella pseudospiralis TaxID=6337 RepID=A0A0V1DXZ9_TRIPS|nr:CTD small phosphatase-like protein 2 [Trichinella pseudospiralis]KRY70533.1 CTD small phosphatase-like protein 2 [Trichinella pseudospiralis]KRY81999.1 CTD small phosphatase-like protein 2 [Trichinella pseudospiralis]KRZ35139.1 CTD small phosphatase-like protein 2 [Trichinella pseudospiralis]